MALINITTRQEFEDKVLKSNKVVLVDFWAEWCPPCHAIAPVLVDVAKELDDIVDVVKLNIEKSLDNNQLANEYQVQSIPNMVIFKNGTEASRIIGMTQKIFLVDELKKVSESN